MGLACRAGAFCFSKSEGQRLYFPFSKQTAKAIAMSARLLQARENPSGPTIIMLKLNNELNTARTKANPDKAISPFIMFAMIYLPVFVGTHSQGLNKVFQKFSSLTGS
jgi:hypothetical protein